MKFVSLYFVAIISLLLLFPIYAIHKATTRVRSKSLYGYLSSFGISNSTSPSAGGNSTTPFSLSGNNPNSSLFVDLNDPNVELNGWLTISSPSFASSKHFPIELPDGTKQEIQIDKDYTRLNQAYSYGLPANGFPRNLTDFYFRIRSGYIFYTSTKNDTNILGSIYVKDAKPSPLLLPPINLNATYVQLQARCFIVVDYQDIKYTLCAGSEAKKTKWLCSIQNYLQINPLELECLSTYSAQALAPNIVIQNITQPLIIIPSPTPVCNEKWDYKSHGNNWECTCIDGKMQSPINLPGKASATLSPLRPVFTFEVVSATDQTDTIDGINTNTKGANVDSAIKIRYHNGVVKIIANNIGKAVMIDGSMYVAEEIQFHTPSEHTINGERFAMEMQILHYGRTQGDIAKQVVLSFLFKQTPGKYNKFIDSLDFYSLPNPTDNYRELVSDIYVPNIFYSSDDDEIPVMKPFSFYTYEGSLTFPPCTERTTHFVSADPIELSSTAISLFKEALRKPDALDSRGNIVIDSSPLAENYRDVQPLNEREVFIYDHLKYDCPMFNKKVQKAQPEGHYEKKLKEVTQYIYINGKDPSGIPGAFVVTESEAKGNDIKKGNMTEDD